MPNAPTLSDAAATFWVLAGILLSLLLPLAVETLRRAAADSPPRPGGHPSHPLAAARQRLAALWRPALPAHPPCRHPGRRCARLFARPGVSTCRAMRRWRALPGSCWSASCSTRRSALARNITMKLTGSQVDELQAALVSAFSLQGLAELSRKRLECKLEAIAD